MPPKKTKEPKSLLPKSKSKSGKAANDSYVNRAKATNKSSQKVVINIGDKSVKPKRQYNRKPKASSVASQQEQQTYAPYAQSFISPVVIPSAPETQQNNLLSQLISQQVSGQNQLMQGQQQQPVPPLQITNGKTPSVNSRSMVAENGSALKRKQKRIANSPFNPPTEVGSNGSRRSTETGFTTPYDKPLGEPSSSSDLTDSSDYFSQASKSSKFINPPSMVGPDVGIGFQSATYPENTSILSQDTIPEESIFSPTQSKKKQPSAASILKADIRNPEKTRLKSRAKSPVKSKENMTDASIIAEPATSVSKTRRIKVKKTQDALEQSKQVRERNTAMPVVFSNQSKFAIPVAKANPSPVSDAESVSSVQTLREMRKTAGRGGGMEKIKETRPKAPDRPKEVILAEKAEKLTRAQKKAEKKQQDKEKLAESESRKAEERNAKKLFDLQKKMAKNKSQK